MTLTARRSLLEAPYQREHQQSKADLFRQPQSLREYLRELKDAVGSEVTERLHSRGVEWEQQEGGSHLGTPRWTAAFRMFITGSPCATFDDDMGVHWVTPHRSALYRMSMSGKASTRSAAEYVFLLPGYRYSVRDAWGAQLMLTVNLLAIEAAEAWAAEALRRWWSFYVEQPRGRPIG